MPQLRIIFMGTGEIAVPSMLSLIEHNDADLDIKLLALVTQPDKPVGKKQVLTAPGIKKVARQYAIPVLQPERARDSSFLAELKALSPDIIVVMAYGQILSQKLLDIPKLACINLHASLLPKYRGAACIQAAIDAGDTHTGITVMHVVKALDAGDIILKEEIPIRQGETGGELHDRLAELAPDALIKALKQLANDSAPSIPQDESRMSYVSKLMREHGEIDWSQPATAIERRIRAYDPWPGTSTTFADKKGRRRRLKIFPQTEVCMDSGKPGEVLAADQTLRIACGEGSLEISNIQPDGSRRMTVSEFLLGAPICVGQVLGEGEEGEGPR